MPSTTSYLCGLATVVFITTGLVIAAVRWFHLCRPFDRNPQYYYPGRPFVVGVYLCALALLPYALQPDSPDAWHLAQMYFLPVTLYHFTILLFAYFGSVMQWRKWRIPMMIIGFPVVVALAGAVLLAIIPGNQVGRVSDVNLYLLGTVMTGICITAIWVVLSWAGRFDKDEFSNPADYPVTFARRWVAMIVVNIALCWAGALAESRVLMAIIMLLFATSSVVFIITALHPHRNRPMEEEEKLPEEDTTAVYNRSLPRKRREEILAAIRTVVEEQEAFLDPHLTLQDVAERSGYNRSYISGLIKAEMGGFFAYVNRLRLAHMDAYLKENPAATVQEAAEESGFTSRRAYYAIRSKTV
ncbi:MAG: helix-turn-helix transcriptional regulator [Bacteroidales bacterium]|nr:helix-turn-helix transcriptional regulator [Bacteroidales bacterium]